MKTNSEYTINKIRKKIRIAYDTLDEKINQNFMIVYSSLVKSDKTFRKYVFHHRQLQQDF